MNNKDNYKFYFDKLKDKQCYYPTIMKHYIISTIKDTLSNSDIELDEQDLFDLCYEIDNEHLFYSIDIAIEQVITKKYLSNK